MRIHGRHRIGVGAGLLSLAVASGAAAQAPSDRFDQLSGVLKIGDLVTVVATDAARARGRVIDLTPASIAISTGRTHARGRYAATDVGRVVRRDSVRNGIRIGAIIGGAAGLAFGVLLNAICENETGGCPGAVATMAGLGLAGGVAAGYGLDGATGNRIVYDSHQPGLPKEASAEYFTSLGTDSQYDSRVPSLSAGVGVRRASGIGVEFEMSHSLGSGVTHVACLPVPTYFGGPDAGKCVGSGEAGIESLLTATGRIVYTFSGTRVRPFIDGGMTHLRETTEVAYASCCTAPFHIIQTRFSSTTLTPSFGGGVRLSITRSMAIRPEVTWYVGTFNNRSYRAFVGMVYHP